ncbi:MAG: ABC transporter substrate-binding protein [Solirubrobacteraceae bacterium]|jgi:peptide/nickel transport system substrate-binding protein
MSIEPDHRLTRRRLLRQGALGSAFLAAGPLLGSAPARAAVARASTAITKGGTLTFARSVAPTQLDPANSIIAGDVYTLDKIFEPLFITSPAGELTPWLAESYTQSSDHLTWTFNLRPGVKFSDGSALDAADVVFSLKREAANVDGPLGFLDSAIKTVKASGSNQVVIKLAEPWAPFLSDISVFANAIIPANFGGRSEKAFFAKPVGTGPFVLDGFTPDSNLTLLPNPHYWQPGKPYVDRVQFNYVADDNQRVLQIQSGAADIIDAVPPANVASLKGVSGVTVELFPAWEVDLLVLNEALPYFADRHVRRAITHAINREALVSATSFGTAKPGGSFFPPSLQYYDPNTPVLSYSLAAAKAELAQSKYPNGFATKLLISGGVEKWSEFAQIIQQSLAPLNIKVTIDSLDHAAFESTFQAYNYDMFIDYAINDISDPDEMASFEVDYKGSGVKSYWSSYNNPAAIALVHEAQKEFDSAKRADLYAQIQAIVSADAPYVPLDYPPYIYATGAKVHGFAVNPGGAYRLENVWLS